MATMNRRPLIAAGVLLGIGMGGFVDGIVFHQILQLHAMLSNRLPKDTLANQQINMFWDGMFHALTWVTTAVGLWMLWRALVREDVPKSGITCFGAMWLGWGLFNFVEGIIDHQILQLHHVVENGNHLVWDMAFLASGVVFMGVGWGLMRAGRTQRGDLRAEPRAV
jgi:uncharacterized membrane protein